MKERFKFLRKLTIFEIECKQTIEAYKVTICFLYNESTTILFKAIKHKLINKNAKWNQIQKVSKFK